MPENSLTESVGAPSGATRAPHKNRVWPAVLLLSIIAIGIFIFYSFRKDPCYFTWDCWGHVEHAQKVRDTWRMPASTEGWQCYHPPVFYFSAAAWLTTVRLTGLASVLNDFRAMQIHSGVYFLAFLAVAAWMIRLTFQGDRRWLVAFSLLLFWPSGIIHSFRIGNDVGFYLFHTLTLAILLRNPLDDGKSRYVLAAGAAVLTLLTKANGFVTSAIVGFLWLWKWKRTGFKKSEFHPERQPYLILVLGCVAYLTIVWLKGSLVTNIFWLPQDLMVGNDLSNIFGFNFQQYRFPFVTTHADATGRQYVSILILKSSLFGEYVSVKPYAKALASLMNSMLLGILAVAWFGALKTWREPRRFVLLVQSLALLVALIGYRVSLPYSPSGDFRYIYPVLISLGVFFVDGMENLGRRSRLAKWACFSWMAVFLVAGVVVALSLTPDEYSFAR